MPEVHCGRCADTFDIDQQWVTRFLSSHADRYYRDLFAGHGFDVSPPKPKPGLTVTPRSPRLASEAPFPYSSPRVAYMCVRDDEIKVISLTEAQALAAGGERVYGAWPGEWRQDVFLLDDLVAS